MPALLWVAFWSSMMATATSFGEMSFGETSRPSWDDMARVPVKPTNTKRPK